MAQQAVLIEQGDRLPDRSFKYRPRADAVIEATQMQTAFLVVGRDGAGVMKGQPGDYLVRGTDGELYVCIREVFTRKYEMLS